MLAKRLCQKFLKDSLKSIHSKRINALFETTWPLLTHAQLTLTSLGRNKEGQARVKHKIKSVDRLLGNPHLREECEEIYQYLNAPLLSSLSTLYILVDWSGCCRSDIHMLRASLAYDGRGITLYNEIHRQEKVGNPQVQFNFLLRLKKMIPAGKKVIIITDAGFLTPWFEMVLKLGWDFVGRITRSFIFEFEDKRISVKELSEKASYQMKYIGTGGLGRRRGFHLKASLYICKQRPKGRKDRSRYPDVNKRYSHIAKLPWILVSSCSPEEFEPNKIRNIYKKRMQIEQNFRDHKSLRWGFGWRMSRTDNLDRISILILIATIASFFLWWLGSTAEKMGWHRQFQVNTVKTKRVLSFQFLAKQMLLHYPDNIKMEHLKMTSTDFIFTYQESIVCC